MSIAALQPSRILSPEGFRSGWTVVVEQGSIIDLLPASDVPEGIERRTVVGDLLPGFIDLQVNGGGGVLFNDQPTVQGIAAIGKAHRRFGTTGFLPTVISDDLATVRRAIEAVDAAIAQGVPGVLGIHLEGPFINPAKKGIHDSTKFRILDADAIELLASLRHGRTLVTLAPELAPPGAIRALVDRGVVVAAGHTAASYDQMQIALGEGLSGFTHLFNAMSQLGSREPGAVGAALDSAASWCSIIADVRHVHPASLRIAAAQKRDRLVLVTDAMPTVGSDEASFWLAGRRIVAEGSHCIAPDGTLAGSNLTMAEAVRNAEILMGIDKEAAVNMASAAPAHAIGVAAEQGSIRPGLRADFVLVDPEMHVIETWIGGQSSAEKGQA